MHGNVYFAFSDQWSRTFLGSTPSPPPAIAGPWGGSYATEKNSNNNDNNKFTCSKCSFQVQD